MSRIDDLKQMVAGLRKAKTETDRVVQYLFRSVSGIRFYDNRNKYVVLEVPISLSEHSYYFIGERGAVRYNTKPTSSDSVSITDRVKKRMRKGELV